MRNLLLAAAAALALGMGTALAADNQAAQDGRTAFANSSHSTVWIYSAFWGNGSGQGGEQ